MVKNSLMPGRLVFLSICVYFQLCYCVRSGTWSVDLGRSTFEKLQSLSGPSTSGQDATRSPCNQTNLEERQESNTKSTEEVKIRVQLGWGREESKPCKTKREGRPEHFKDGEMRGGKCPKLSNGTTDDNGQYNCSSSSNGTTLNGTRASHDGQRDKRSDGQESCGKDDRAAESLGASPPNCIFVCESSRSDVPNSTSQSSIAVARKFTSTGTYANSVCSSTVSGVGNEETSLSPVCSEVNSTSERRMTMEEFYSRLYGSWEEMMKCNKEAGGGNEETSLSPVCSKVRESEEQGKEEESGKDDEMESQKACKHNKRRCEVWFPCCRQFYRCHRCHNSASNCGNDEAKASHATHLKCSRCQFIQEINGNSAVCSGCGVKMAEYFCFICKSFESVNQNPYHCEQCGICRIFKDKMYHCEVCNVCLKKRLVGQHKCKANSGHDLCGICLEDVFESCHIFKCGHKVHCKCAYGLFDRQMTTCPECRQSILRHC